MFNTSYLNELRQIEMEQLLPLLPSGARILEFGAGTGQQARFLADHGFDVIALDLPNSDYAAERLFPIHDYDGRHIPLADQSVDVVFSSNVLEHVEDLPTILGEFRRVTRPNGLGIHIMPTPSWRFWTFVTGPIASLQAAGSLARNLLAPPAGRRWDSIKRNLKTIAGGLLPLGHGTSREGISELWTFSPRAWRRKFERSGFAVVGDRPFGIFYTGNLLFGPRMSVARRESLSHTLGSAARIYEVRTQSTGD